MSTPKAFFAIALWNERSALLTLGGVKNGASPKEVQEYSLPKNIWKPHSQLLEAVYGSSAVVFNHVIYSIGRWRSSHSVMWCRLACWKFIDLPNSAFKGYYYREAFALENKIVYLGSWNENASLVLEKEGESEQLKVAREDEGIDLVKGGWNTASWVFKTGIYAFKTTKYNEVYRYSLEIEKWCRYSPHE